MSRIIEPWVLAGDLCTDHLLHLDWNVGLQISDPTRHDNGDYLSLTLFSQTEIKIPERAVYGSVIMIRNAHVSTDATKAEGDSPLLTRFSIAAFSLSRLKTDCKMRRKETLVIRNLRQR